MKVLSLNVWGGRSGKPLLQFLKDHEDVDVFCFQEMYHDAHGKDTYWFNDTNFNLLEDIQTILPNHTAFFHPHLGDWWGLAMLVKKDTPITDIGEHYVHLQKGHNMDIEILGHTAKNIQYLTTTVRGKPFTVLNFHGLWNGQGKGDTDARIEQSKNVINFAKTIPNDFVLIGDLNLSPNTKSLCMLEDELLLCNLIKENNITSTRSSFYEKENKYADYALVSKGAMVKNFEVLKDEVSDHLPLYIEIE